MSRYIVLELPFWAKYKSGLLECTKGEVQPIFNRNGLYLDRKSKTAWVEYKGKAYDYTHQYDGERYSLNLLNHKPLTNKETQYINFLIRSRVATKDLKKLYYTDRDWKEIRETGRSARKVMLEIRKV
jgi:hypothetical protein